MFLSKNQCLNEYNNTYHRTVKWFYVNLFYQTIKAHEVNLTDN